MWHKVNCTRASQKKLSFRICPKCPDLPRNAQKCPKYPELPKNCPEMPKMPRIAQIRVLICPAEKIQKETFFWDALYAMVLCRELLVASQLVGFHTSPQPQRVILANNRHARAMVCSPHLQKIDRFAAELENHPAELGGLLFTSATRGDPGQ